MNLRCPDLPFLPGYTFNPMIGRTKFNMDPKFDFLSPGNRALVERVKPNIFGPLSDKYPSTYARGEVINLPAWIAFDKQVLVFDAFFTETMEEVRGSPFQIREVKIYFYLEDGTIKVVEKRKENSGIKQGVMMCRQRIRFPAPMDENFYDVIDFNVGREVEFYGRVFKLTACDRFTRTFLNRCGIAVPDPLPTPTDPYVEMRKREKEGMQAKKPDRHVDKLGQFLKNDRKVLRFYGSWDDSNTEFGYKHDLAVHYHLADDTMEIIEKHKENSGHDGGSMFLRRQKLPKVFKELPKPGHDDHVTILNVLGAGLTGGRYVEDPLNVGVEHTEYYKETDLTIGGVVNCYGRKIVLTDWDAFTKAYYSSRYGLEPLEAQDTQDDRGKIKERELPPWNGYGSHEDSAQNCKTVEPKPPHKDFTKFLRLDKNGLDSHVLRFKAKMISNIPANCERSFIISYFLSDDSIAVYEVGTSTSAKQCFFSRAPIKMPGQKRFTSKPPLTYQPQHMFIGATILINGFQFVLTDADEYCLRYMELHPNEFPKADIKLIMGKVREKLRPVYKDFVAENMPTETPVITYRKLRDKLCQLMGEDFTEHEMITISRVYSANCTKERFDRSRVRALTLTELKKFLWDDLARLREYLLVRDTERTGKLTRKECYTVLRACRLPLDVELINKILDVVQKDEECNLYYEDLVEFLNRDKCPMADVEPLNIKYQLWWASEREPEAGTLIDWCAFNKELDLESTFQDQPVNSTLQAITAPQI